MAIKSFSVSETVYDKFSKYCKAHGVSMSKQVELFMNLQIEEEPKAKKEFLERLERIRKGKFIKVDNFAQWYGLE